MAQRASGYERKERDLYETPPWVTNVICEELLGPQHFVWEPAAGSGKMQRAMQKQGLRVFASDISPGEHLDCVENFLNTWVAPADVIAIVTNPPYIQAESFVRHALDLMRPRSGIVAMLLRADWDSAKTRRDLFADHPAFAMKLTLLDRIQWFDGGGAGPSVNHAWFAWDWMQKGRAPMLRWAGNPEKAKKVAQLGLKMMEA